MNLFRNVIGLRRLLAAGLSLALVSCGAPKPNKSPQAAAVADRLNPALARQTFEGAWEIINQTFYDTNFHGLDWGKVRQELLPKAETAPNRDQLRIVIQDMLDRLGQSHMRVIPGEVAQRVEKPVEMRKPIKSKRRRWAVAEKSTWPSEDLKGGGHAEVGMDLRLVKNQLLVVRIESGGPADLAQVKRGWAVSKFDGQTITEFLSELPPNLSASERAFLGWQMANTFSLGRPGSVLPTEFVDGSGKMVRRDLRRANPTGAPVKLGHLPELFSKFESKELRGKNGARIGYLRFNLFMLPVAAEFDKAMDSFRQREGIVIDLRGNLGGIGGMIMGLAGYFFNEPVSLGTMKLRGMDLKIMANPRQLNSKGQKVGVFKGPVAILIDRLSLSASEIFAGGMQELGRAKVFGEPSGGQALPALWDTLPDGDILYHAIADFSTPAGVRLEARGVVPDQEASYDRASLLSGRDVALERAVDWLDSGAKRGSADP